jgi:hypothetical protein|tara:strand:+ start:5830 stop:6720 length:891 start_codon:yes stop_codon:yes gene_type:complete
MSNGGTLRDPGFSNPSAPHVATRTWEAGERITVGQGRPGDDDQAHITFYDIYEWDGSRFNDTGETTQYRGAGSSDDTSNHYGSVLLANESYMPEEDFERTDWGAANISAEDFVDAQGNPLTVQTVFDNIKNKIPGFVSGKVSQDELLAQINKMLPKFQGVSQEDKDFLKRERALEERGVQQTFGESMYGLQESAYDISGAPTTGAGMRGKIRGQRALKSGAESAYGTYGLGMDRAELGEEKGLYGLKEQAMGAYETEIEDWMGGAPAGWFKGGGRVPNKEETFLHFLTQLPDAGGT